MASFYSGVHQKIKSHLTPWPDKLKLARFAWTSRQCFIPNKEQALFDWTTHALSGYYSKKVDIPLEVLQGLWIFLDDILHSKQLNNILKQGTSITLNPVLSRIISERILEGSSGTSSVSLTNILSCCQGILTSSVLSLTYTARFELLVELVSRVCGLASFQLSQQDPTKPLQLKVFEVLLLTLSTYYTVQGQQGNSSRVFNQVTEHLLQPLCLLRHLLSTRTWTTDDDAKIRQQLNKEIRSKVDTILQSALFYSDLLAFYKEEVLPSVEQSGSTKGHKGRHLLVPVATILSKLVQRDGDDKEAFLYAVRTSSLPLLFKLALDSFYREGENKLVCFHLVTKFIIALDFTDDLGIKDTFNTSNWSLALLALENLLNTCLTRDIYNVAADKIHHGEVQLKFYRKVVQLLFNNSQTGMPAWYRCLKTILALNHQVLEPDLDELVSSAWVDADNMELRVKKARESLVCTVIQTYAKLRQLPRLIEELLDVIRRPAADELRQELLPEAVQKCFSQCLLDNPPSQNLEICRLILEAMQSDLIYVKEMRNESALKLFSMSVLLHAVLFSLKTLDDTTPVLIVKQTQTLMGGVFKFVQTLVKYIEGMAVTDRLYGEKIQELCLLLNHTWYEADSLFQIHCSKYISPAAPSEEGGPVSDTIEKLLVLTDSNGQVTSPLSKLLQKLLALHRMKKHMLIAPSLVSDAVTAKLCQTAQYIVNRQEPLINLSPDQTWDLQLCSINNDTYPVACWYVISTNLPLIAPYLSQDDISHIADAILTSLQSDSKSTWENTNLSGFLISKQLIESRVLCELPNLHSAVVKSLTKRIIGVPSASDVLSLCPSFFKSCTEICVASVNSEESTPEISPSLQRLKVIAQEMMHCFRTGASIPVFTTQVDSHLQLMKIVAILNPYAMSPEDHTELFLSLFLMTLCVEHDANGQLSAPISLLKELFGLLALLMVEKNSQMVLKVVHGSTLLEATMTSVFSCFGKGLFQWVETSSWFSFLQSLQGFIQSAVQLMLNRKSSVRINLEKFNSFMIEKAAAVDTSSVDSEKCKEFLYSLQLHLATLSTLCKEIMSVFGRNTQLDKTLTELLGKNIYVMGPAIQSVLKANTDSVIRQSFSVDVVSVMIKSELAMAPNTQDIADEDEQYKFSLMGMYKDFGQQILNELCQAPQPMDFLISSIHYLSVFYLASVTTKETNLEGLYSEILQNVYNLFSGAWLSTSELKELEEPVKDLLNQLLASCSQQQFKLLLLVLREGLVASKVADGNYREVLAAVTITKLLACCSLPETCSKMFWDLVPQIISTFVFVVRESSNLASLTSALTVPVVETLTTLLRQGETHLSNPHSVILVLGALQFVPLENQAIEDYCSAFEAMHEALFAIILCYPKVMLKAAPTFLNCFYRLVTSIIHEGRQKGDTERERFSEELLKCAMLVERMYTHIATTAEGFTVMSSFIVAQYVSELQRVTLRPEIKAHLTEGIYRILDQCVEQDIKFLNATLPMGVKEVVKELHKNYTHYHKSQRQGEEKYTA